VVIGVVAETCCQVNREALVESVLYVAYTPADDHGQQPFHGPGRAGEGGG